MTRKCSQANAFVSVGGRLKTEVDGDMARKFSLLCERFDISMADVIRKMIWEFIETAELDLAGGGH